MSTQAATLQDQQISALRCMEIFGGNLSVNQSFEMPGLDVELYCQAIGGPRGGDIHYLSTCGRGEVVRCVVADVAGHGASVSDVADSFRQMLSRHINKLDQSALARKLNSDFAASATGGRFVTTLFFSFHRPSGHLVICNAGHPRPVLFREATGKWEFLDDNIAHQESELFNIPLGIVDPTDYRQFAVRLSPGDRVLAYTDGLTDRIGAGGRLGDQGLLDALNSVVSTNKSDLVRQLRELAGSILADGEQVDDETILLLSPSDREFEPLTFKEQLRALGSMLHVVRPKALA